MKVLIIDDIEESVRGIIDYCHDNNWEVNLSDFNSCYKLIFEMNPDVIVMDWREDTDDIDKGEDILNGIWINGYRPIIIFSANVDIIDLSEKEKESNLIEIIRKGDETPVKEALCKIEKYVVSLSAFREKMSRALIESLNSVEYLQSQEEYSDNAVTYILSKRTSEFFGEQYTSDIEPYWVQYICPPISESLCVCDIIRSVSEEGEYGSEGYTNEYRIILTPSCDMATNGGRIPKVTHILCAHCEDKNKVHGMSLADNPTQKNIEKVLSKLTAGHNNRYVPLPRLPQRIPYMSVDLKNVELVPIDEVALSLETKSETSKFYRVASICSPYREQIVWAHMLNSCRPGVPDRNMENWAKDILST